METSGHLLFRPNLWTSYTRLVICAFLLTFTHDVYGKETFEFNHENIMKNVADKTQAIHVVKDSDINTRLKKSVLDFQRLGYEKFITSFLRETNHSRDETISSSLNRLQDKDFGEVTSDVSYFIQRIADDRTKTVSSECLNDTARILRGILSQDSWILPFVDSTGKPGPSISLMRLNFVGNYEQCRSSVAPPDPNGGDKGFTGNYCVVGAALKSSSTILAGYGFQLGLCAPSTCSEEDLFQLIQTAVEMTNTSSSLVATPPECHTDEREVTTATIMAIVLFSIIASFMLAGTCFDLLVIQQPLWRSAGYDATKAPSNSFSNANHLISTTVISTDHKLQQPSDNTPLIPKSSEKHSNRDLHICYKALLAFSVYTNGKKVLNTSQPPGSLGAIHGIRFLSMSWVLLAHLYASFLAYADNWVEYFPDLLHRWTFDVVSNGFPSVDTFFTLSGLLTSYLTIKEMTKKSWRINWPLFYFHRFWRLTPPYMLVLLLVLGLQRFWGSGALWSTVQPEDKTNCEDNWWTNFLYVNNLVNTDQMCFAHSWYLANDMQFFILSPLMMIPFYFHPLAGLTSCGLFLLTTWVTTGVLSTSNDWPATIEMMNSTKNSQGWMSEYYIKPWCRIGPFIVGILAGYVLAKTNGGRDLKLKRWLVVIGWLTATASGLAVVYGLNEDINGEHPSSLNVSALYNSVARSVWGACVAWVIIACAAGYGGPVNMLLSWSPFVFLGRLTYMSYLIHPSIVSAHLQNGDSLPHLNDTNLVITYLGLVTFVNMAAFVLMLAFESPMIGLEKVFIRKESRD